MRLHDFYEPIPALEIDGFPLRNWSGHAGANLLLLWRQGEKAPVNQLVDDEFKMPDEEIHAFRLQEKAFRISTRNPVGKGNILAECTVRKGKWVTTKLLPPNGK